MGCCSAFPRNNTAVVAAAAALPGLTVEPRNQRVCAQCYRVYIAWFASCLTATVRGIFSLFFDAAMHDSTHARDGSGGRGRDARQSKAKQSRICSCTRSHAPDSCTLSGESKSDVCMRAAQIPPLHRTHRALIELVCRKKNLHMQQLLWRRRQALCALERCYPPLPPRTPCAG
ncbi:hypothetical protein GQ54DRAFT_98429 [Martensiomyces pterosporus]|nr:hypothetical protein GQ54DRAFT_98429 [Martensiomyces pterosporus]